MPWLECGVTVSWIWKWKLKTASVYLFYQHRSLISKTLLVCIDFYSLFITMATYLSKKNHWYFPEMCRSEEKSWCQKPINKFEQLHAFESSFQKDFLVREIQRLPHFNQNESSKWNIPFASCYGNSPKFLSQGQSRSKTKTLEKFTSEFPQLVKFLLVL